MLDALATALPRTIHPAILVCAIAVTAAAEGAGQTGPARVHPGARAKIDADGSVKAWIFFRDKGVAAADLNVALRDVENGYDARAIDRRNRRRTLPGLFDAHDLPVAPANLAALDALGIEPIVTSRWLNGVSAMLDDRTLAAVTELPGVLAIEPVRRGRRFDPPADEVAGGVPTDGGFYGAATVQLEQINLPALHATGATGDGIIIGILDTGFRTSHEAFDHPDNPLQIVAQWDFINDDPNPGQEPGDPSSQHRHGTLILGTLAAYMPNVLVGAAYEASYILCKTEDTSDEYQGEEDFYVAALEFIEANGGDVATSSLSYSDWYTDDDYDGVTCVTTVGVNIATGNGIFCCTAAGNRSHDSDPATATIAAPADAFEVFTVGAVENTGDTVDFSSDGPTFDGRVKPEVMAQGRSTETVDADADDEYRTASGTSLSTPLAAGAVACMAQAQPSWTVAQMRDLVFQTASYAASHGGDFDPLYVRGYGIIDAMAAVALDCNGNGVADPDDIAGGTSSDVDGDDVPDECQCIADVDGSGDVGFTDLLGVIAAWGPCGGCPEDIDGSGEVGFTDLLTVISAWGPC